MVYPIPSTVTLHLQGSGFGLHPWHNVSGCEVLLWWSGSSARTPVSSHGMQTAVLIFHMRCNCVKCMPYDEVAVETTPCLAYPIIPCFCDCVCTPVCVAVSVCSCLCVTVCSCVCVFLSLCSCLYVYVCVSVAVSVCFCVSGSVCAYIHKCLRLWGHMVVNFK